MVNLTKIHTLILGEIADTVIKYGVGLENVGYDGIHPTMYPNPLWNKWNTLCEFHIDGMFFLLLQYDDSAWFVQINKQQ